MEFYQERVDQQRSAQRAAFAQAYILPALPVLSGTEKQVSWANDIRSGIVDEVVIEAGMNIRASDTMAMEFDAGVVERLTQLLSAWIDARQWIDHRDVQRHHLMSLSDAKFRKLL